LVWVTVNERLKSYQVCTELLLHKKSLQFFLI